MTQINQINLPFEEIILNGKEYIVDATNILYTQDLKAVGKFNPTASPKSMKRKIIKKSKPQLPADLKNQIHERINAPHYALNYEGKLGAFKKFRKRNDCGFRVIEILN
tara:strand:- start:5235 stop:5558 length:324 start_codon:yes stop_codon:yes gene_type:complete